MSFAEENGRKRRQDESFPPLGGVDVNRHHHDASRRNFPHGKNSAIKGGVSYGGGREGGRGGGNIKTKRTATKLSESFEAEGEEGEEEKSRLPRRDSFSEKSNDFSRSSNHGERKEQGDRERDDGDVVVDDDDDDDDDDHDDDDDDNDNDDDADVGDDDDDDNNDDDADDDNDDDADDDDDDEDDDLFRFHGANKDFDLAKYALCPTIMSNGQTDTEHFLSHAGLNLDELQMTGIVRALTHFPKAYNFYLNRNGSKNTTLYCAGRVSR